MEHMEHMEYMEYTDNMEYMDDMGLVFPCVPLYPRRNTEHTTKMCFLSIACHLPRHPVLWRCVKISTTIIRQQEGVPKIHPSVPVNLAHRHLPQ